ncbi:MAG TPA: zinc-dependent alcohol dehydrogenase family protein [Nocardioidaceae bacterium]
MDEGQREMSESMRAWTFDAPAPVPEVSLTLATRPIPVPGPGELLIHVQACGVCRTDLHLIEGDLMPRSSGVVPGHQVVGTVVTGGSGGRFQPGERVGVAWLRRTCGTCRWCRYGAENLCPDAEFTGWDADGGLAEYATVPEAFAYRLPTGYSDETVAPLLCAGIIGYRALLRANLPRGGRLGLYGFGSSAHITAQIALAEGAELFVMTRGEANRTLATDLGASFVGEATDQPPEKLDSAIVFAPAGELVPVALGAVDRGGTVALAGIHMSDVPQMAYERLFLERDLRTVTCNTRRDGEELLRLASRLPLAVHTTTYPFDKADQALFDLSSGAYAGSGVVLMP